MTMVALAMTHTNITIITTEVTITMMAATTVDIVAVLDTAVVLGIAAVTMAADTVVAMEEIAEGFRVFNVLANIHANVSKTLTHQINYQE